MVSPLQALELGLGLSAIEEGDDRLRPGVMLHTGYKRWMGRFFYYGRKFGPVTERTYLLSATRKFDLYRMFGINFLRAGIGAAIMDESIEISFAGDSKNSDSEHNFNLGFNFGIYGNIPIPGPVFVRLSMETHLFLAGQAGILLANGRKQMITLASGIRL